MGMPENANLAEWVREAARASGTHPAFIDDLRQLTWEQADAEVDAIAAGLVQRGLHAGERVALLMSNSASFATAYFGVLRAGLVCVPINPAFTAAELAVLLADSGARLLLAERSVAGTAAEAIAAARTCEVLVVDDPEWAELVAVGRRTALAEVATPPQTLAVLLFTAGTSGRPKGAMLTHGALRANNELLLALDSPPAVRHDDVVLAVLPLFHVYGLNTVLGLAASVGATSVILDRFDPREVLTTIAQHGVTTVAGVPAMYRAWCQVPQAANGLADVRLFSSGGSPLPVQVYEAFTASTGRTIYEGYGMTEAGPVVCTSLAGAGPKAGSVGPVLPGMELRLVDGAGSIVDEGDPGEVWVRGPSLFTGYWPDGAGGPDAEGWFRSGDVAVLDGELNLHLIDRRRELILVNGFNVYPREVELAIESMPAVAEVAVVGVADDRTGEAVTALVVPAAGQAVTVEQVLTHCERNLARFKWPTVVRIVDTLPHSATGKIAKGRLREVYGIDGAD
jgi:long-chain acyl-CoA synthetase